jgi:hypothetical protein
MKRIIIMFQLLKSAILCRKGHRLAEKEEKGWVFMGKTVLTYTYIPCKRCGMIKITGPESVTSGLIKLR